MTDELPSCLLISNGKESDRCYHHYQPTCCMWKTKFTVPFRRKISINVPISSRSVEAMDDPPIKHGYLFTPPQGKLLKRTWQKKYYALYKASNYGVERVEVFDNEDSFLQHSSSRKIIPLNDCVKVVQAPQKNQQNVFDVITKGQMYQFSADTTQELAEWLLAFQMVAFGGQRRDLPPSTPPPSYYSSGPSQTSSTTLVNAEEENQIYSSFSGPEVHVVKVLETEASIACGLQGSYILVVSTIQLVLLEEGSNVNGKKYLFAWPYRHIRRYGRSKDLFTFEAGRKCTSGAGTFTFNTNDANAIFLSVQASMRTLKREEEDAAFLTPSIIMNRTVQSWPLTEDANSKSQSAINPLCQTSLSTEFTSLKVSKSDSKDNHTILDRVLSRGKVLPPFAKPPRKGKLSSTNSGEERPPAEPVRFELSSAARAKLAKSASSSAIAVAATSPSEPTYAEPEVRNEAWKVFGMESDNFHKEKMPDAAPYDDGGGMYASIAVSPTSPTPIFQWSPTKKEAPRILTALKRPADSGCYDHLSQFVQQSQQPSVSPNGHIYTRLVSVVPSDLSQTTSTTSRSSSPESSGKENHQDSTSFDNKAASDDSSPEQQNDSEDIKRFFQNDEVYTVVAKPFRKFNTKSNDV